MQYQQNQQQQQQELQQFPYQQYSQQPSYLPQQPQQPTNPYLPQQPHQLQPPYPFPQQQHLPMYPHPPQIPHQLQPLDQFQQPYTQQYGNQSACVQNTSPTPQHLPYGNDNQNYGGSQTNPNQFSNLGYPGVSLPNAASSGSQFGAQFQQTNTPYPNSNNTYRSALSPITTPHQLGINGLNNPPRTNERKTPPTIQIYEPYLPPPTIIKPEQTSTQTSNSSNTTTTTTTSNWSQSNNLSSMSNNPSSDYHNLSSSGTTTGVRTPSQDMNESQIIDESKEGMEYTSESNINSMDVGNQDIGLVMLEEDEHFQISLSELEFNLQYPNFHTSFEDIEDDSNFPLYYNNNNKNNN
eukprot:TRINITY_DN2531_c2_g1_i4.p1 TRINITY_DN2531_c2_g1~~TRINITY_DN2531_c2_g1_i4.p1  ORF type:complete len:351 (+),score=94.71 TRINITY_DN2531_c2_g1_i4:1520-2572(+)